MAADKSATKGKKADSSVKAIKPLEPKRKGKTPVASMNINIRERRLQELRKQAETLLAEKIKDVRQVKLEDVKEIVYELQVHQIELEMQSEELRHIQAELQESQNKYLGLYNSAPAGYFTLDKDGVILEVNTTGAELLGIEKLKLLMTSFTHLISPDSQDTFYLHCKKLFKTGSRQNCEITLVKTDGSLLYAHIESIIMSQVSENLHQHRMMVVDISERKQAEEALILQSDFNQSMFDTAQVIMLVLEPDGRISTFNPYMEAISGYKLEEVKGKYWFDVFIPERDRVKIKRLFERAIDNVQTKGSINAIVTKDGREREIEWYDNTLKDLNGKVVGLLSVGQDVTERKQAQEKVREVETLKEIERLRTELLANISHELRTPLTSIKGFATMLLEYEKKLNNKEKRKFLKTIDLSTDRLLELIDQLLDISRLDAGMLTIDNKPANINKLIQDVVTEARFRSADHRLLLDLPGNLPVINIDTRRIRQVLENLIDNAVKYSKADTDITITARRDIHELLISVADKGIGIPQEELPRVFDRFFRSNRIQIQGIQGVGLGLPICKRLIETQGGRIWMESEEGKGCTCFFTLPINIIPGRKDTEDS